MILQNIHQIFESWAPKEIAWERDNIGLQIGSLKQPVKNILITLDVSDKILEEARKKKADLIISHHPLLFQPLKSINYDERVGRLIQKFVAYKIALYSAHTNLDFTKEGVSFSLAERIGLKNIDFLFKGQKTDKKIVVFTPVDYADVVISAMANAGAGLIGNYESCSFTSEGVGTFKSGKRSKPFIGKVNRFERVKEMRIEMVVPNWKTDSVISAMKVAHPYEEIAYDIYSLDNPSNLYGAGAIGTLPKMNQKIFLKHTKQVLNIPSLRYSGNINKDVERVAVCGGSGSDLLPNAIQQKADAFITADISYHRFEEARDKIILIDGGHFETEFPVIRKITLRLKNEIKKNDYDAKIIETKIPSNNIQYLTP
jgi:dinuclear metal center YbgI/SA1388 family protein